MLTHLSPNERSVVIVAGSPNYVWPPMIRSLCENAGYIVAVDSGAKILDELDVPIDLLVGDMDSIDPELLAQHEAAGCAIERVDVDKDLSDLAVSLEALERRRVSGQWDVEEVFIFAALGGRRDHELVAIGDCARSAHLRPILLGDTGDVAILSPEGRSSFVIPANLERIVSVLPVLGDAVVSERDLRWTLDHVRLGPLSGVGLSNEIAGPRPTVVVHEGVAAVILTLV